MQNKKNTVVEEGIKDFDWNELSFDNYRPKAGGVVYAKGDYVKKDYKKYNSGTSAVKDITRNGSYNIEDIRAANEKNHVIVTINNGACDVDVDLSKDRQLLNLMSDGKSNMSAEMFVDYIKDEDVKRQVLNMNLAVSVNERGVGSMWNGYKSNLEKEFLAQIKKPTKAYRAKVTGFNNGGCFVSVMDIIDAFMPGSLTAIDKVTDYSSLVGQELEVMIENYMPNMGFIVSRKKYQQYLALDDIKTIAKALRKNPDKVYEVTITAINNGGIFFKLSDNIIGKIDVKFCSEEFINSLKEGEKANIYISDIDKDIRIVGVSMNKAERDAIIKKELVDEVNASHTGFSQTIKLA